MPTTVLKGLAELIPCAGIGFFEVDRHRRGLGPTQLISSAGLDPADICTEDLFFRACWDRAASSRTEIVDPVTTWQDCCSESGDSATLVAGRHPRRIDSGHGLLLRLPDRDGVERWIVLIRHGGDTPFSERDQLVLTLLQPHLAAIRDRVEAQRSTVPGLTARQLQLLRHVARGETNRQIARHLGVTESTVRTHLEHIYSRLGAHSRIEALAVASPLLKA
jgi:DNA-binding CsgD family transcriptional regulator